MRVGAPIYVPDGERVKGVVNGVTTVYVGNHYEVQGATVRKYYYAGAQRVAMREAGVLYWLLTYHLGSTAIVANASGAKVGEVRYKAWGEERPACPYPPCGTIPTTYWYTGQRWESGIGLYFYQARWYDPALGRFVQPDTVVPDPGDSQGLNRYSYVKNNPLKYIDPSGLYSEEAVRAYMEYVYGAKWYERWEELQGFYYALLAAEAGDFIFSIFGDSDLYVYQILGTEDEIWGLRKYEKGVGVDLGVEARERYTKEDVNAWAPEGEMVGAYRIGGQAHVERLYGVGIHTVSLAESSIPAIGFALIFAFVPWPTSEAQILNVILTLTRAGTGAVVGVGLQPLLWPDATLGNDIIGLDTYGPEGYVGRIVIERGLIVNFVYAPYMVYYNLPPGP